ncbi:MAG: c-type cytochrome [Opitutales bacterium]
MSKGHSQGKENKEDILPGVDRAGISDQALQESHADLMERKEEPSEGFSGIPIFMLFLMSALLFAGGIYMVHFAAGYDFLAYVETYVADPDEPGNDGPDPIIAGRALYEQHCVACHQQTGQGIPGVFPPLSEVEWVTGSEERLIRIPLHGLAGPIEVKGNTYNGVMPGFAGTIDDRRMSYLLTYIRQAWENDASPVTADEVAAVRAAEAGRTQPWTAPQLEPFAE